MVQNLSVPRLPLVFATLALAPAAVALAAPRAHIAPTHTCYVRNQTVRLKGRGFSPGGEVFFRLGKKSLSRLFAQHDGTLTGDFDAPTPHSATSAFTVKARDRSDPSRSTSTRIRVARTFIHLHRLARNRGYVIRAHGFTTGHGLWVHYLRRGHVVHNTLLGRLRRPCGSLSRTRRLFAFRPLRRGRYWVVFDSDRRCQVVVTRRRQTCRRDHSPNFSFSATIR